MNPEPTNNLPPRNRASKEERSSRALTGSATGAALAPEMEREAGAEREDCPCRIHRALYNKSDDPEHADNRNSREFLDGYAEGYSSNRANGLDGIADEWERRGSPEELSDGFREWKRGYNAGSMRRSWEGAREKASCSEPRHSPSVVFSDSPEAARAQGEKGNENP